MNSQPRKSFSLQHVRMTSIYKLLVFLILIVPDDFFTIFAVYTNKSPGFISYRWLNYSFNVVLLVVLLLGLVLSIIHNEKRLWGWIVLALIRELLFLVLGMNSCFSDHSYEIYLTLLTGISLTLICKYISDDVDDLNSFFWISVICNVITVYLAVIMRAGYANRYNAINMDVGSTGTICALTIMYCLLNENIRNRVLIAIVALIALFLSGSRVNLLLTVLMLVAGFIIRGIQHRKFERNVVLGFACLSILGFIALVYFDATSQGLASNTNLSINRMLASFSFDGMGADSSVLGRTTSIGVGIDIIRHNLFGISGYFTNLQTETVQRGFPTFPHSSLIDYYIFLGPLLLLLIFRILRTLKRLWKIDFSQFIILLYMFTFITISGGPIVNFKIIYFYSMIILISSRMSLSRTGNSDSAVGVDG